MELDRLYMIEKWNGVSPLVVGQTAGTFWDSVIPHITERIRRYLHASCDEVTAQGTIYLRQKAPAVLYALRMPLDSATLTYGTDGELAVGSESQTRVQGLAIPRSIKANADNVAISLTGVANPIFLRMHIAAMADATVLPSNTAVKASPCGHVSGGDRLLKNILRMDAYHSILA